MVTWASPHDVAIGVNLDGERDVLGLDGATRDDGSASRHEGSVQDKQFDDYRMSCRIFLPLVLCPEPNTVRE